MLPLFSWGREKNLLAAVEQKKNIDDVTYRQEQAKIHFKITQAYWGYLLYKTILEIIHSSKKDIDKIKNSKKNKRYRIILLSQQIELKENEVKSKKELTLHYLNFLIGENEITYKPKDSWLTKSKYKFKTFNYYYQNFYSQGSSDLKRVNFGIKAKKSLLSSEQKSRLPQLGLIAGYTLSNTPTYSKQQSSFAYDPYNDNSGLLGVGIKWDIDFGVIKSKVETLKLEIKQLKYQKVYAQNGFKMQLFQLWQSIDILKRNIVITKKSLKTSKKWYKKKVLKYLFKNNKKSDNKEIADAYKAKTMSFLAYYKSIYDHRLAIAKLKQFLY